MASDMSVRSSQFLTWETPADHPTENSLRQPTLR
jgi:hypothetical protein